MRYVSVGRQGPTDSGPTYSGGDGAARASFELVPFESEVGRSAWSTVSHPPALLNEGHREAS